MIKKIWVVLTITALFAVGVMAVVTATYAQDAQEVETQGDMQVSDPEMTEETNAYNKRYQNGSQNGETDPIETQTRTQTRELLIDGDCTGECEPQQLHLNEGIDNQGTMLRNQENLSEGECAGECEDPLQLRSHAGSGNQGAMQQAQNNTCDGECTESGTPQQLLNQQNNGSQAKGQAGINGDGLCDAESAPQGQRGK